MNSKIFLTGLMSLVMANASLAPVLANPVIEQKRTEKQEVQDSSAQNSVVLTPATKDTPGAVQMIPVKDYIALKGEASLEGKQILEVMPQSSARNKNDKDFDKNNKSSLTPEADYFVVLPQGQELSAQELEQVEGEVAWWVPGAVGAAWGAGSQGVQCWAGWTSRCSASDYAVAAGAGAVSAYAPGGRIGKFVVNQGIKRVIWR
ncbi:MAG: hypothetical protein ACK4YK_20020 [Dolichospermum sp.]|jgi:hypothetical protein